MINYKFFAKNKNMKKYIISLLMALFLCLSLSPVFNSFSFAEENKIFYVYDENGNFLMEKEDVSIDDIFLTQNYEEWKIYAINEEVALAKKQTTYAKPFINLKKSVTSQSENKNICLYMTHNDESYNPSDGYDSIYGKGGIHDVAKNLKDELSKLGISALLDETLHIPHDSSAYTRSKVTATKLQNNYHPIGLFDIHRDGASRSLYLSQNDIGYLSKIRIVVGKGNANFEKNYNFAKKVFSVGQALYPWLFLDVYCGKGTYNQNLQTNALIFEMGSNLIEKEYVLKSTPYLASVLNTVLFASEIDNGNQINIDEETIDEIEENYIDEINLSKNDENIAKKEQKSAVLGAIILSISVLGIIILIVHQLKKRAN